MLSIMAIFISASSMVLAAITLLVQRKHNKLTVRPIAELVLTDQKNLIEIAIRNNGVGPLMCNEVVTKNGQNEQRRHITDFLSPLSALHSFQCNTLRKDFWVAPGDEMVLFSFKHELDYFSEDVNQIRSDISQLLISVLYSDIYNQTMPLYTKSLSWFNRKANP